MKVVLAFEGDHDPKQVELPSEFLNMVGLDYISTNDDIYTVRHTEFNITENTLYFWVN